MIAVYFRYFLANCWTRQSFLSCFSLSLLKWNIWNNFQFIDIQLFENLLQLYTNQSLQLLMIPRKNDDLDCAYKKIKQIVIQTIDHQKIDLLMFTPNDEKQFQAKGIEIDTIEQQIENFKSGFPYIELVAPATSSNGMKSFSEIGRASCRERV